MWPVNPNACVQEAIHMAAAQTQDKDIRFGFSGLDKEITVLCDADKLQEVILNLLINGLASIDKSGEINIGLELKEEDILEICISDTGSGIRAEHLDKIFQPFFTTRKQGTGLGLSICKQIIEAHKGHISVESTIGKGTAFTLSLPLDFPGE
jgi:two-component system sensor histidine kinase HydH